VVESLSERLLSQTSDLLVVVSEPTDRGRVGGVTLRNNVGLSLLLAGLLLLEKSKSLLGGDGVGDVSEASGLDELLL
jgi:hypothetical protein